MHWRQTCLRRPNSHSVHLQIPFPRRTDGSRGNNVTNTPEFGSVLGGSGREQEGGETGGDKPVEISGEGQGAGLGGPGVQTRVGGSSGPRARVTRGLK